MERKIDFFKLNFELSREGILMGEKPVIERQAEIIEKFTGEEFEKSGIKQIVTCKMKDIFIVYEDGTVLKNFKPYGEKIRGIFKADKVDYVIFEDNKISSLYSEKDAVIRGKFDKVLFDENFLVALKGGNLTILSWVWGGDETCVFTTYEGVDDVKLIHTWEDEGAEPADKMMETEIVIEAGGESLKVMGAPMIHS